MFSFLKVKFDRLSENLNFKATSLCKNKTSQVKLIKSCNFCYSVKVIL